MSRIELKMEEPSRIEKNPDFERIELIGEAGREIEVSIHQPTLTDPKKVVVVDVEPAAVPLAPEEVQKLMMALAEAWSLIGGTQSTTTVADAQVALEPATEEGWTEIELADGHRYRDGDTLRWWRKEAPERECAGTVIDSRPPIAPSSGPRTQFIAVEGTFRPPLTLAREDMRG